MEAIIFWIIFIVFCILVTRVRKVPDNTVVIIDRNSHFHKKKKHGYYLFNSATDKVTTQISTNDITESYRNIFKTHDDNYYELSFTVKYHAIDIDKVLASLEDSRRSIYDVVNCSIETVMATLSQRDVLRGLKEEIFFKQLESMLEPFYIDVTAFRLYSNRIVDSIYGDANKFNRHISSGENPVNSPIKNSYIDGIYADDPFAKL